MRRMHAPLGAALVAAALGLAPDGASAQVTLEIDGYVIEAPSDRVAEAKARELTWSHGVFEDLFALTPPQGKVILRDNPNAGGMPPMGMPGSSGGDGPQWTLPWFAGAMPGMPAGAAGGLNALTHEAAHLQLVHLVNDGCTNELEAGFNGYGSYLPDWVDEAVAVHHEPDGQKRERRQQLKTILGNGKHIPLAKYFTMDHPIGGKGMAGLPPGMMPPPGGGVGGGVLKPGALGGLDGEANTYYVQSLSVIEYLCDRAGKPFFRFCVHELQQGRTMDEVLAAWHESKSELRKLAREARRSRRDRDDDDDKPADHESGADGSTHARGDAPSDLAGKCRIRKGEHVGLLPRDVETLERDWMRWVQQKYPRFDPGLPAYPE